eukprot:scaffold80752_cov31-Tisochrysis_lutea.AAC.2
MQSSSSLRASASVMSAFHPFRNSGNAKWAPMPDACEREQGCCEKSGWIKGDTTGTAAAA